MIGPIDSTRKGEDCESSLVSLQDPFREPDEEKQDSAIKSKYRSKTHARDKAGGMYTSDKAQGCADMSWKVWMLRAFKSMCLKPQQIAALFLVARKVLSL